MDERENQQEPTDNHGQETGEEPQWVEPVPKYWYYSGQVAVSFFARILGRVFLVGTFVGIIVAVSVRSAILALLALVVGVFLCVVCFGISCGLDLLVEIADTLRKAREE